MRLKLYAFAAPGLIITLFSSAILCCCLTDSLHAQEPAPSCHSANHNNQTPQNTDDCDCDRSMAIIQNGAVMDVAVVQEAFPVLGYQTGDSWDAPQLETVDHAPPIIDNTSPPCTRHSILRV